MKIQTFSIVAGSAACNARCPFCISKMTVDAGVLVREPNVNWRNFRIACDLAARCEVTTAMITGKGEPTLFPRQISDYLGEMCDHGAFPIRELQTNGIPIMRDDHFKGREGWLQSWYDMGLTTIALSVVHWDPEMNREIYTPQQKSYVELPALIELLHTIGFSVRLSVTMLKGFIDGPESLQHMIEFAKELKVEQLSVRPVNRPKIHRDPAAHEWVGQRSLDEAAKLKITAFMQENAIPLMTLMHGAVVYDYKGQNVCLTDCLTRDPSTEDIRQLIFFPDGHLRYDWEYEGAIIL